MVSDAGELWLLASPDLEGLMGWGLGSSAGSTFSPAWGRIRLSPRRGSVSRASITPQPLSPSWAAGQRREGPGLLAESRPSCMRDLSCGHGTGMRHGRGCGTGTRQHLGLPKELPQLSALLALCRWKGAHSPHWGLEPSARVPWLWHRGLSGGTVLVTLSLPPSWTCGRAWAGLQGLRAQQGGIEGTSGRDGAL